MRAFQPPIKRISVAPERFSGDSKVARHRSVAWVGAFGPSPDGVTRVGRHKPVKGSGIGSKHGPSIRDDDKYEALRDEGMSKEKAARIANSGRKASVKGGHQPAYEEWTKEELYDKARDVGVEGRSEMSKSELIDALRG